MQSIWQNLRLFTADRVAAWCLFIISFGWLTGISQAAYAAGTTTVPMSYAGRLTTQNGAPMAGAPTITATFWDAEISGTQRGEVFTFPDNALTEGIFSISFSFSALQVQDIFGDGTYTVYIEIVAEGKTYPRQKFNYVPLAMRVPVDGKSLKFSEINGRLGIKGSDTAAAGSILASDGSGGVTWIGMSSSSGTITAGKGLSGGQIVTSGTISLADTAVTPGSYARANIVVDQQGRITSASNSTAIVDADISAAAAINPDKIAGLSAALSAKQDTISSGTMFQYLRGDKTWQALNTANVPESGTAQYFSDARARSSMTGLAPIVYSAITGEISLPQADGSKHGYLASTDWATFNAKQSALGYTPLNRAGDTMNGSLSMGGQPLSGLAAPSAASDAATKAYVDTSVDNGVDTRAATLLKKDGSVALTGPWGVGNDLTNVGNVTLSQAKTLGLGVFDNTTEATMIGSLNSSGPSSPDKGKTWFNKDTNLIKYWDGVAAVTLGVAGSGLSSLNGQTGNTQTFAVPGTTGTAPAWASSANAHTLNIPMASAAAVTAGLLSNTDYTAFSSKVTNVAQGTGIAVATASGTATVSLATTGTAGNYAKVTTDAYGRVTAGTSLLPADLPPMSAGLITSGTLNVANGGTGSTSLALNNVILGNGTSPVQAVAPGTNGNVLTSNGTTWVSAAPSYNWTTSGSDVYRSSGNVGIGTSAPAAQLQVGADGTDGRVMINGAGSSANPLTTARPTNDNAQLIVGRPSNASPDAGGIEFISSPSGPGYGWKMTAPDMMSGGNTSLRIHSRAASATWTERMTFANNGNIGVGTINPGAKLHVGGTAGTDGIMFPDGTLQKSAAIGSGASQWTTNGSNIYFNGGSVGVGTSSPTRRMHILDSVAAVTRLERSANTAYVSTDYTPAGALSSSNLVFATGLYPSSSAYTIWSSDGTGDTIRMVVNASGNVGIATNSPGAQLHVWGRGTTSGWTLGNLFIGDNANYGLGNQSDTASSGMIGFAGGGANLGFLAYYPRRNDNLSYFRLTGESSSFGDNPVGLLLDGRVGIGTGSPATLLDIEDASAGNGTAGQPGGTITLGGRWYSGASTVTAMGGIRGYKTALDGNFGGGVQLMYTGFGQSSLSPGVTVNHQGQVGIGTTAPGAKLHVAGTAGTDGIMFPDGTLQKTAAVGSGSSQWTTTGSNIYFNSGNVGLGTANPTSKLHVLGPGGVGAQTGKFSDGTTDLLISVGDKVGTATAGWSTLDPNGGVNTNTGVAVWDAFHVQGTTALNGNVGIGTTSGSAPLTVLRPGSSGLPSTSGTTQAGLVQRLAVADGQSVMDFGLEGPATGKSWIQATNSADLSVAYHFLLNPRGGNVGIGTTAPGFNLDVAGAIRANGTIVGTSGASHPAWALNAVDSTQTYKAMLVGNANSLNNAYEISFNYAGAGSATNRIDLGFYGNQHLLNIQASGNIGVGTTSPSAKLEVAGTPGTDGIKFPDGSVQTSASGNVSLYYTANTATALTANAMSGAIAFGNKIWDTHNAFNGSTFTAPSAGIYQVSGCLNSVNGALNAFELNAYKNNARYLTMNGGANYTANVVCGTALAKLAASDTLDLRAYTTTSGASTFGNGSTNYATWIQIIRMSN